MPFSAVGFRRSLLTGAGLLIGSAVAIGVIVIPQLRSAFPPAAPERGAVPVFLFKIALNLLFAIGLVLIALKAPFAKQVRRGMRRLGLGAIGFFVMLFGIALIDGAFAYHSYGAAMALATVMLFVCSAAEVGAGLLSGSAAIFLPATDTR